MAQEINENIHSWLLAQAEEDYRAFTMKLLPGTEHILGVRLPVLRKLAKKLARGEWQEYLTGAADDSMEEIMLQGMTLGYVKASFEEKKPYLDVFVGKIDNWSVCDSTCSGMKPQSGEDVEAFFAYAVCLAKDRREFVARFGIVMLLDHFITDTYIDEELQVLAEVSHDGYYVKMAVAWAISICYVKFEEKTMVLLRENTLDDFTYNKSLQKITESYRVSKEDKARIRSMKRVTKK